MLALVDWLGGRDDEELDPAAMQFAARKGGSCRGCLFARQRAKVCTAACEAAARAGLPQCEEDFIYVPVPVDPRQMVIGEDE